MLLFLIGVFILAGLALFVLFDCIVALEYDDHNESWNLDGKPGGFFWQPSEFSFWTGSMSRSKLASALLAKTPDWMRTDQRASRLLFWYRLCWWVGIVCWVALIVQMFVSRS